MLLPLPNTTTARNFDKNVRRHRLSCSTKQFWRASILRADDVRAGLIGASPHHVRQTVSSSSSSPRSILQLSESDGLSTNLHVTSWNWFLLRTNEAQLLLSSVDFFVREGFRSVPIELFMWIWTAVSSCRNDIDCFGFFILTPALCDYSTGITLRYI